MIKNSSSTKEASKPKKSEKTATEKIIPPKKNTQAKPYIKAKPKATDKAGRNKNNAKPKAHGKLGSRPRGKGKSKSPRR